VGVPPLDLREYARAKYSFRALLSVSEMVDNMRKAMFDFSDDYCPTISSRCLFTILSGKKNN
jgi:hypothetical protein